MLLLLLCCRDYFCAIALAGQSKCKYPRAVPPVVVVVVPNHPETFLAAKLCTPSRPLSFYVYIYTYINTYI